MDDILNEAYAIAQCKDCAWYKACVIPMRFTAEDIRRQMEQQMPGAQLPGGQIPGNMDLGMDNLLSSMASAAQNSLLEGCPVFITRLRNSQKLGQRIKELMQHWGEDEEE